MEFRSKTAWLLFAFCLVGNAVAVGAQEPSDHDGTNDAPAGSQTSLRQVDTSAAPTPAQADPDKNHKDYEELLRQFAKTKAQGDAPDAKTDLDCTADRIADLMSALKCFLTVKDDTKNKALLESLRKQRPELVDALQLKLPELLDEGSNEITKPKFDAENVLPFNERISKTIELFERKPLVIATIPGPLPPALGMLPFAKPGEANGDSNQAPAGTKPGINAGRDHQTPGFAIASEPVGPKLPETTHETPSGNGVGQEQTGTVSTINPGSGSKSPGGNSTGSAGDKPASGSFGQAIMDGVHVAGQAAIDVARATANAARAVPIVGPPVGDAIDAATDYFAGPSTTPPTSHASDGGDGNPQPVSAQNEASASTPAAANSTEPQETTPPVAQAQPQTPPPAQQAVTPAASTPASGSTPTPNQTAQTPSTPTTSGATAETAASTTPPNPTPVAATPIDNSSPAGTAANPSPESSASTDPNDKSAQGTLSALIQQALASNGPHGAGDPSVGGDIVRNGDYRGESGPPPYVAAEVEPLEAPRPRASATYSPVSYPVTSARPIADENSPDYWLPRVGREMSVASMVAPVIAPSNPVAAAAAIARGLASSIEQASRDLLAVVTDIGSAAQDDNDDEEASDTAPAAEPAVEVPAAFTPVAAAKMVDSAENINLDNPKIKKLIQELKQTPKTAAAPAVTKTQGIKGDEDEAKGWPSLLSLAKCKMNKLRGTGKPKDDLAVFNSLVTNEKDLCPEDEPSVLKDLLDPKAWQQPQANND